MKTIQQTNSKLPSVIYIMKSNLSLERYHRDVAMIYNGLAPNRRHAITWTDAWRVHWRIYAVLGGNEFKWSYKRSDAKVMRTFHGISCLYICIPEYLSCHSEITTDCNIGRIDATSSMDMRYLYVDVCQQQSVKSLYIHVDLNSYRDIFRMWQARH